MFVRLLKHRWLVGTAILLVAAVAATSVAVSGHGGGAGIAVAQTPVSVKTRIETLHKRPASRTKEEDPDDRPAAVSPERAAQIALQTLRGQVTQLAPGIVAPLAGAAAPAANASVRKLTLKHVQGKAVIAVIAGSTEVDIDRETGTVLRVGAPQGNDD